MQERLTLSIHANVPDVYPTADPRGLGEWLQQARLQRGLSLQALSARMCTTQSIVEALEREDFDHLGAPIYVIGHLRNYARAVELPVADVLTYYNRHYRLAAPVITPVKLIPRDRTGDWLFAVLFYPLASGCLLWLAYQGIEQAKNHLGVATVAPPTQVAEIATPAPVPPPPPPLADAPFRDVSPQALAAAPWPELPQTFSPLTSTPTPEASPVPPRRPLLDSPISPAHAATNDAAQPPSATGKKAELVLAFSEVCWLEVRDRDDNRLAYGMQQPNTVNTLSGKPPFTITLGNAQATRLVLNGETVDIQPFLPKRGSVARFLLPPTE